MKTIDEMVKEFHDKFNAHNQTIDTRFMFLLEEFRETQKAFLDQDMVELADGLGDLIYVATGMLHKMGVSASNVVEAIHSSNMSKTPAAKPGEKVRKGTDYFAPTAKIEELLK